MENHEIHGFPGTRKPRNSWFSGYPVKPLKSTCTSVRSGAEVLNALFGTTDVKTGHGGIAKKCLILLTFRQNSEKVTILHFSVNFPLSLTESRDKNHSFRPFYHIFRVKTTNKHAQINALSPGLLEKW